MALIDNFGEVHKLTVNDQSSGGKASGKARREKRDLRRALELLLERDVGTADGETITGAQAISARLYREALQGNVRAFEVLRDTVGQKPVEKIMVAEVDADIISEVERAVLDGSENGS